MTDILVSLHGNRIGLDVNGNLVLQNPITGVGTIVEMATQAPRGRVFISIPAASVLTLNSVPVTVIPAPGAGLAIVPTRINIYKAAGTAYAGVAAGEDLVLKYTNGSGAQCTSVIETTGFLDQATAQYRTAISPASTGATAGDVNPAANAAVVLALLVGDITTGTSPLNVEILYNIVPLTITA